MKYSLYTCTDKLFLQINFVKIATTELSHLKSWFIHNDNRKHINHVPAPISRYEVFYL